tara:strand:+ start:1161 stop:1988 length:828 start_codon:yes stop_codon:yes gene_type:complete
MLDNLSETSEVADKFYNSTDAEEPEEGQPDAEEAEDGSPVEDDEELVDEETEELDGDEDDEGSTTVFGQEITQEEFKTMKDQQLMHADYTKKTQVLADKSKTVEALNTNLTSYIAEFESLIVNEESEEELAELKEDDYVEFLRRKEIIDGKKKKLNDAKGLQAEALKVTQADENVKLMSVMSSWSDPKKGAATQKADVDTALSYAAEIGFNNADLEKLADHKIVRALIDAGKYSKLKKSKPSEAKRKTPASKKVSKKTAQGNGKKPSAAELFYGK